jgi:hypothetical protein
MEMITTTELLDFLRKAQRISILDITFTKNDEGYYIILRDDWYNDNHWSNKTVFIDNEGNSTWEKGDYDFYTMNNILDEKLEEQLQKEIKEQKRQELLARLTDEEKELLNLK